jgi:hypothetical protein
MFELNILMLESNKAETILDNNTLYLVKIYYNLNKISTKHSIL